jgi:chromosome segregation ATPase
MKAQLSERLQQLKNEFESGQRLLTDLEQRQQDVRSTLLRIGGAIQVLEEELAKAKNQPE